MKPIGRDDLGLRDSPTPGCRPLRSVIHNAAGEYGMTGWKDMPSDDGVVLGAGNIPAEGQKQKAGHFQSRMADVSCRLSRPSQRAVHMYDAVDINFGIQYKRLCLRV
jgi:hypothetical protein